MPIIDNEIINQTFATYYGDLYKSDIITKNFDPMPFLKTAKFKCLSIKQKEYLIKEITISEVKSAIDGFLPKKEPGLDGLPIEFYSTFWTQISSLLLNVINNAWRHHVLPETMYQAIINVIPKPGQECNTPSEYRPISLINSDNKIIGGSRCRESFRPTGMGLSF